MLNRRAFLGAATAFVTAPVLATTRAPIVQTTSGRFRGVTENGVARFGESLAHLSKGRTQTENVRPYEHTRMVPLRGMYEISVRSAIRGLDLDFRLRGLYGGRPCRQCRNQAGTQCQSAEFAPGQPGAAVVLDDIVD